MSMEKLVVPTGGCIKCIHCEKVRSQYFCGKTRLSEKQLYNKLGYCSKFEDKAKDAISWKMSSGNQELPEGGGEDG